MDLTSTSSKNSRNTYEYQSRIEIQNAQKSFLQLLLNILFLFLISRKQHLYLKILTSSKFFFKAATRAPVPAVLGLGIKLLQFVRKLDVKDYYFFILDSRIPLIDACDSEAYTSKVEADIYQTYSVLSALMDDLSQLDGPEQQL